MEQWELHHKELSSKYNLPMEAIRYMRSSYSWTQPTKQEMIEHLKKRIQRQQDRIKYLEHHLRVHPFKRCKIKCDDEKSAEKINIVKNSNFRQSLLFFLINSTDETYDDITHKGYSHQ